MTEHKQDIPKKKPQATAKARTGAWWKSVAQPEQHAEAGLSSPEPLRLDPGARWHSEGIADKVPPVAGASYRTLVPAVDADGNELAGIRLPEVEVPLATYMGWNLRDAAYGAGGVLAGLHGGYLEFSQTADPEDPRPSILERYPNREAYLAKFTGAVLGLQKDGYLLDEDAMQLLHEASERDFWKE